MIYNKIYFYILKQIAICQLRVQMQQQKQENYM